MMGGRRRPAGRLRRPATLVHDRRAVEIPFGAIVATREVPDPYAPAERIVAATMIRDDPLGHMYDRGQIMVFQFHAGRHWQWLWETTEIGGLKAMDTTKEPVDGGRMPDLVTDQNIEASRQVGRLSRALGPYGRDLVIDVLAHRMFIRQAAAARGLHSQRCMDYLARRFRECLDTLAYELGYVSRPRT